ncbi:alpha-ketoglutarate-dependent dioxygenase alkB homolog 7, mitochondrial [Maniola jurtina]|uniref:alpha-ketoglutarate-dependent dioxygenase alkB homolog 7, mitochondrial n=1 Tax=Maniola jurtina TaxID=191418 RepID=UPI001E6893D4|nr:alpha-ketoglutarate-dependent dioxygenase alkB homolog 7, mitochondrial [Maniola jurtina]XP_045769961.1 alpha-ketoglutarate-dependent dioxygenase alkB homolog 7, mitochondrial [Maniola jurtina]
MRLLTFSILKNCKLKPSLCKIYQNISVDFSQSKIEPLAEKLPGDTSYIEILPSWKPDEAPELRLDILRHMRILPNFVTEEEECGILAEVEPQLKRMRYEYDHWDNAIEGYRETERGKWNEQNEAIISRVREVAFAPNSELLPYVHVLDLAAAGHIKPHVDAVRFCGDTIAGLCLASSAVMRLTHEKKPHLALDALLERRCLYIMSGVARYSFSHAVLGGEHSVWRGERLPRRRRVAVICREQPRPENRQ